MNLTPHNMPIFKPKTFGGAHTHCFTTIALLLEQVENERFEVDMAIERNLSTCRLVEPYAEEVTRLREDEEKDGQPIVRLHYRLRPRSLHSSHIGAIARIYGERGDEVIHHLLRNPISVLPIVMKRLREKDTEWKKARTKMLEQWKLIAEANYEGSLDTLCYFYRREIERSCNNEVLLEVKIFEYCSCSAPSISLYHICSLTSICQLLFS